MRNHLSQFTTEQKKSSLQTFSSFFFFFSSSSCVNCFPSDAAAAAAYQILKVNQKASSIKENHNVYHKKIPPVCNFALSRVIYSLTQPTIISIHSHNKSRKFEFSEMKSMTKRKNLTILSILEEKIRRRRWEKFVGNGCRRTMQVVDWASEHWEALTSTLRQAVMKLDEVPKKCLREKNAIIYIRTNILGLIVSPN